MMATVTSGFASGTLPQWGMFITLLTILVGAVTVFIKGMPERKRVRNEEKIIDNAEAAARYKDFRTEVHDLKNQVMTLIGKQAQSDALLLKSAATNIQNMDDMDTLLSLIRLLISEVKRLDPDPDNNIIISQCDAIVEQLARRRRGSNPLKSDALTTAETAVRDARKTVRSAEHTVVKINVNEAHDQEDAP